MTEQTLDHVIEYPIALEAINALADEYMPLRIDGIDDKTGQAVVRKARLDVKSHRVAVEKKRKTLKAGALEYGRKVDSAAKLLTAELAKIEEHLKAEEQAVEDERRRIAQEAEARRQAALQKRLDALTAVSCVINPTTVAAMDETAFADVLSEATSRHEARLLAEEAERQQREQQEAEQKQEAQRLAAERERLEAERTAIEAERQRLQAEPVEANGDSAEQRGLEADTSQTPPLTDWEWVLEVIRLIDVEGWPDAEKWKALRMAVAAAFRDLTPEMAVLRSQPPDRWPYNQGGKNE